MKTSTERLEQLKESLVELGDIDIVEVKPTLCTPYGDDLSQLGFARIDWAPMIWQGSEPLPADHSLLAENRVFSIGLSSVMACLQLKLSAGDKLHDMCAAPGIKSLYLQLLHNKKLDLYANDLSHQRLLRLRRLFEQFGIPQPTYSNQPGQTLTSRYTDGYFDAILLDAPCSGEGTVFGGDTAALQAWSPAKVKRLSQLQRKLILTAKTLIKPEGQLIYATCTLNQSENERVLRKANMSVGNTMQLSTPQKVDLQSMEAVRVLPSSSGIGFFVAKIT